MLILSREEMNQLTWAMSFAWGTSLVNLTLQGMFFFLSNFHHLLCSHFKSKSLPIKVFVLFRELTLKWKDTNSALNWYHLWSENPSQWTILEPLCYSSFVFATLVYGVIGYKYCWLIPQSRSTRWTRISWDTNWARIIDNTCLKQLQNLS